MRKFLIIAALLAERCELERNDLRRHRRVTELSAVTLAVGERPTHENVR